MLILSLVLAGIIGVTLLVFIITEYVEWGDLSKAALIIFVICLISCIVTIVQLNNISYETKWEETWRTNIIALKDNSNIEGKLGGGIFVVSGYINESMYYYCMENTPEGKHMIKIPSDNVYIIETNDVKPSIIKKTEKHVDKRYDFWLIASTDEKYTIYVPKGTVDTTYKVDME